jgi:hypothetical protein
LSMKIQNHQEFPEFDHRAAPSRQREQHRRVGRRRACQGSFWKAPHYENWGIFKCHFGENYSAADNEMPAICDLVDGRQSPLKQPRRTRHHERGKGPLCRGGPRAMPVPLRPRDRAKASQSDVVQGRIQSFRGDGCAGGLAGHSAGNGLEWPKAACFLLCRNIRDCSLSR